MSASISRVPLSEAGKNAIAQIRLRSSFALSLSAGAYDGQVLVADIHIEPSEVSNWLRIALEYFDPSDRMGAYAVTSSPFRLLVPRNQIGKFELARQRLPVCRPV